MEIRLRARGGLLLWQGPYGPCRKVLYAGPGTRRYRSPRYARAFAYKIQGDFTAALADADQNVKIAENQYAYGLRADIRGKAGDLDGAIADYSKAIKFQNKEFKSLPISDRFEDLVRWYQKRGIVYEKKEAWGKAIQDYQEMDKFLKDGPARARLLWQIGLVYEQKGDAKNAQKYFSRATAMDPGLKK